MGAGATRPASSLLALLQLSDSAFPTGSFSHSLGLEALVAAGVACDEATLEATIADYLGALSTSDCAALRGAAQAGSLERVVTLDRALAATKLARESRAASAAIGASLLATVGALRIDDALLAAYRATARDGTAPGSHAIVYGLVVRALGIDVREAVTAYVYATAAGLTAAGQRLLPLGQRATQSILFRLHDRIAGAVEASVAIDPAEPFAFAPVAEIASMAHERQQPRLYIS
jgi:urease accessory protein